MREVRPDHVAIYVRWSTDDQSEGTTLEVQLEGCRHYARSQGWEPRDELTFIDDGYSGGTLLRPALTRLRALVIAGEIDCIVVFKVDRLSRNIVDAVELVLNEWQDRCFFKSAREPIDTGSDLGRVIFGILAMFADFERSQIRERTQSGKVKRIAEGRQLHGQPAYGYKASGVRGQWAEETAEAELVRRMFRLAAGGESASAICRTLNGEGLRTRTGKPWSLRAVLWILRNRVYIGEAVYGRTQLKQARSPGEARRSRRVARPAPTVHTATQAAPPLVPVALFEAAQVQLQRNAVVREKVGPRGLASVHLLVGLARCRCGTALVAKQGRSGVSYICPGTRTGRCGLEPGYIPQPLADRAVTAQFLALHGADAVRPDRLARALDTIQSDARPLSHQRAAAERALAHLADQEERILRAARDGGLALQDLQDLRAGIRRDRAQAVARVAELNGLLANSAQALERGRAALEAPDLEALFARVPVQARRALLRAALAGPVVLFKPKGSHRVEISMAWAAEVGPGTNFQAGDKS